MIRIKRLWEAEVTVLANLQWYTVDLECDDIQDNGEAEVGPREGDMVTEETSEITMRS